MSDHSFQPNWASPPGDTINDILYERGISPATFASKINLPPSAAKKLLTGVLELTPEIAKDLSELLGASDKFWLRREQQYRGDLVRLEEEFGVSHWLEELPVKDMIKLGWIKSARSAKDKAQACLDFFGVKNVADWRLSYKTQLDAVAFRTSETFNSTPGAVISWLRQAELESTEIDLSKWNPEKFRSALIEARSLTRKKEPSEFLPQLQSLCASAGVAVVIVRAPSGCRASGATRFPAKDRALLALSFRYLSDDHFWFTFFHEAAHLLLHSKELTFIETSEPYDTAKEAEANKFSEDFLIPVNRQSELLTLGGDYKKIMRFARAIGISPGIVVGQMQYKKLLRPNQLNSLKKRYKWS
jgi:HTH-type transcriptional regulator/antitoxin HigA